MKITVLEFLSRYPNGYFKGDIYFKPFKGDVNKIEYVELNQYVSLFITDEMTFTLGDCINNSDNDLLVLEDEITYLRRRVKEQRIEINRLNTSVEYYRDVLNKNRRELSTDLIHAFMPRGYASPSYLCENNKTPYRRGIANSLFFLLKRGEYIPDDVVPFMERYKTRKTTRRKK